MTIVATAEATPPPVDLTPHGSTLGRLVHSELLKIRTTNTWWLFGAATLIFTGLAQWVNMAQAASELHSTGLIQSGRGGDLDTAGQQAAQHSVAAHAANIFTSGQYFGGMFVMLLAILMITNEYYHQMATTTFLSTPHRTSVIMGKFVTAMLAAALFWLVATALDLFDGYLFFAHEGFSNHLGDWTVLRAILVNLMVYALWAVFGVGIGVLIRSQLGATITATLLYLLGTQLAQGIFFLIYSVLIHRAGVLTAMVLVPAVAAQVAVSTATVYPYAPSWWVGVLVLLGYGVLMGAVGILIMRRRDIS